MASVVKRSRSSILSPDEVLQRIFEEGSDNEGMSSGEESEIDRQLAGLSEESR